MFRHLMSQLVKTPGLGVRRLAMDVSDVPNIEKSVNRVTLLGRVGVDPQLKGSEAYPVVTFSLATNSTFKMGQELKQKTEWHRISIFKPYLKDSIQRYVRKGNRVMIIGRIAYGEIIDKNGVTHPTTSIVADDVIFVSPPRGAEEEEDLMQQ